MKCVLIDKFKAVWPLTLMCLVLGVSVIGFHKGRQCRKQALP